MKRTALTRSLGAAATVLTVSGGIAVAVGAFSGSASHRTASLRSAAADTTTTVSPATTTIATTTTVPAPVTTAPTEITSAAPPSDVPTTAAPPPRIGVGPSPHFVASPGVIDLTTTVGHAAGGVITITDDGNADGLPMWTVTASSSAISWNDLNSCIGGVPAGGSCQLSIGVGIDTQPGRYTATVSIKPALSTPGVPPQTPAVVQVTIVVNPA